MTSSTQYLLFCIRIFLSFKIVLSQTINMTEFREIDSDFDLQEALQNFKAEDFDPLKIENATRTSAEDKKLIEEAHALIDTSDEKEKREMLLAIEKREKKNLKVLGIRVDDMNIGNKNITSVVGKRRVKRQGKFAEAANVDNLKMLRIYLTMFKNLWAKSYTGGAHPLHHSVPKPVVILFKQRLMEFFFPPIGNEGKKVDK